MLRRRRDTCGEDTGRISRVRPGVQRQEVFTSGSEPHVVANEEPAGHGSFTEVERRRREADFIPRVTARAELCRVWTAKSQEVVGEKARPLVVVTEIVVADADDPLGSHCE